MYRRLGLLFSALSILFGTGLRGSEFNTYQRALEILTESEPRPTIGSIASGFGSYYGTLFIAVSYSDKDLQTGVDGDDDGSLALGFGLGNPNSLFAGEVTIGVTSVSTSYWGDGKFADEGNINFKLHKKVSPIIEGSLASLALGVSNFTGWGTTKEVPVNNYLVYSETRNFGDMDEYGFSYSLGYGSAVAGTENAAGIFGGLSVARDQFSTSLSTLGGEIHLSATWYPKFVPNTSLTVTRADISNNFEQTRSILTFGYSLKLER